jgi:tRNA(fMet)-specific endonuclease VapC
VTYLLDTNTCIGWQRNNQPQIVARIQAHGPADIVLCSVVVAELLFGVERSYPAHRANAALRVEQLRQLFVTLPFHDAAAEQYGKATQTKLSSW